MICEKPGCTHLPLYVGRLAAAKGLPILLQSLAVLKLTNPDIQLTVIGDGEDRAELESQVKKLGLDPQVTFVGYQSSESVRRYLQSADIFVMSSFAEGVPVVLMEAMMTGLPVVATQVAGVSELVGKSGSGKTTLIDILLGLLSPDQGDIKVDGRSIYSDVRGWQNLLGYIPQSIFLTDSTIEQNIAYGVPLEEIDAQKLREAIAAAQLEDHVDNLPDSVKTEVGERVSGGQRQRIGIARALYHNREILVLDEATSALDSETEQLVSQAINSLAGSRTLIIIAHRYSTIEKCDRIYELSEGQLKQSGTCREIIMTK